MPPTYLTAIMWVTFVTGAACLLKGLITADWLGVLVGLVLIFASALSGTILDEEDTR